MSSISATPSSAGGAPEPKVVVLHARYEKIEALKPDLILALSDSADITNDLSSAATPSPSPGSVAEILR